MRTLSLLAATILVAANTGAQTPLTIDPSFEYYIPPELIEQYGSGFTVNIVLLRPDDEILTLGNRLCPPGSPVTSGGSTSMVDGSGAYVDSPFQLSGASGRLLTLPNGQFFGGYKRYNPNGQRDWTFGYAGLPFFGAWDWDVLPDRSVLVGGRFKLEDDGLIEYGLLKVDEWGGLDPTFTARKIGPGTSRDLDRIYPLANGQYLMGGSFTTYDGEFSGPLVRINPDGSRDPNFYFPAWKGEVAVMHEQPDGKLVLGGRFFMNDVPDTLKLVRVFPDGSLDPAFNNLADYRTGDSPFSAMASGVNVLTPLNDGRFVVGGMFTHIDGQPRSCIACTDTLGNLLDCWAGGGLVPQAYTPGGGPIFNLSGFECLSNGDCYIFGQYKGFIDANGLHPRQCIMSRIFMPTAGVGELRQLQSVLEVWPNPGSNTLAIRISDPLSRSFELEDVCARVVMRGSILTGTTHHDTSALPGGVYLIRIALSDGRTHTTKWIKT